MLDSLDTLIAFVLIMLVVSLLITIVVQMCAAVLNLRGWNLLVGLRSTFAVIAPDAGTGRATFRVIDKVREEGRKELARYLLKGGLLSDSFLPRWLSLWRHASAIRPGELFDAIHRVAIGQEPASENLKNNAAQLLIALGVDPETIKGARTKITDAQAQAGELKTEAARVRAEVAKALEALPDEVRVKAQNAMKSFGDAAATVGDKLTAAGRAAASAVVAAAGDIDSAYEKFRYWTCIAEERAQQWVTMHTRILTIIFAFVFAFWLQLDIVEIFELVSSNKEVRDKLVAQASAVETQAARVLVNANVVQDALKIWSNQETDSEIKNILSGIQVRDTETRENIEQKVSDALKDKKPIHNFDSMVTAAAKKRASELSGELGAVKADLDKGTFQLFPDNNCGRWGSGWGCLGWPGSRGHRLGIFFSVGLLSLGAPFWYNILKNLVSLRSKVAENISAQKEQAQKQPGGTKLEPPPTVK